jgi:hypothetical protein
MEPEPAAASREPWSGASSTTAPHGRGTRIQTRRLLDSAGTRDHVAPPTTRSTRASVRDGRGEGAGQSGERDEDRELRRHPTVCTPPQNCLLFTTNESRLTERAYRLHVPFNSVARNVKPRSARLVESISWDGAQDGPAPRPMVARTENFRKPAEGEGPGPSIPAARPPTRRMRWSVSAATLGRLTDHRLARRSTTLHIDWLAPAPGGRARRIFGGPRRGKEPIPFIQ